MKIESRTGFLHLLLRRCKELGIKKISKFGFAYSLYLLIVWTFNYFYMPWLAIKFQYAAIIPLYFSLLVVSLFGLLIYRFFREDIFFLEKINKWLNDDGASGFIGASKRKVNGNPRLMFVTISVWWSPLHSYLFFKKSGMDHIAEVARSFVAGSFYCALFWGAVIDLIIFTWRLAGLWGFLAIICISIVAWKIIKIKQQQKHTNLKEDLQ